jgi:hypothetical protein
VWPPASRADRSRPGWGGHHQRCRGSWPETAAATAIGPRPPTPLRTSGPCGPSRPSWCCGRGYGRWWRPSWPCAGHRSRSRDGCRWPILRIRCCGCRTRPSTCRCSCRAGVRCAVSSSAVCGRGGRCAPREASACPRAAPRTRAYVQQRTTEGLSKPEIIRCVKRYLAPRGLPRPDRRLRSPPHP